VLHVSPILFGPDGIVGGGERAAYGFARAVAREVPTTLATTGSQRARLTDGDLRIEIYPSAGDLGGQRFDPLCYRLLEQIRGVDVVHCHQYRVAISQLAILAGAALGTRTFVTDLGGVGIHFDPQVRVEECLSGLLGLSAFSLRQLPSNVPSRVIPTGVGELFIDAGADRMEPTTSPPPRVLYVGRVMRHKGIDVLIESLPEGVGLDVVGHVYDESFYSLLRDLAVGRDVRFVQGASDEYLVKAYGQALVTVLPSVYRDVFGGDWEMPELLGCVLQESMACGTPAICSDVGGMPEIVEHGVSGFVVPPNDPRALGQRIAELLGDPALRRQMGRRAREMVLERFTWPIIARRTLDAYREL
jgi:glycosyltransferase involved in cell wall biosynthesis